MKKKILPIILVLILGTCMNASRVCGQNTIDVVFGSRPTIDGVISTGEYADANSVTFATAGGTCTVYFKHDESSLYVAFDVPNVNVGSAVQIFVDTKNDQASLPQTDDYRFTISLRPPPDDYGENQGTGTHWTVWGPPNGWSGAHQTFASTWNAEFAIPYQKLGITAGIAKTIGMSFWNAWTLTGDHHWPTGASWLDPSSWGTASSSCNWGYYVTIAAWCSTTSTPVSVSIVKDGTPTVFTTPHTFVGLTGTHKFTVPNADPGGHTFMQWMSGEQRRTITVTSKGTYTADYFLAGAPPPNYGPRIDDLFGSFIEGPTAQTAALTAGTVDAWFDIKSPFDVRAMQSGGFTTVTSPETFQLYYIAFNMRDQENPSGGSTPWRAGAGTPAYYTYWGATYSGYVPLDDQAFRHACAHCIPKDDIVATVYGGAMGAAIDSTVPEAQRAWYKSDVDGHLHAMGDPFAATVYNPETGDNHDACSILRYGGYVWEPTAPNPAPKYTPSDPNGNWLDPHLGAAVDDPETVWDDTEMMPMNHITFAGVTVAFSPTSWWKDDMCVRDLRAIGLPIQHVGQVYSYLTHTMMDYYQYDVYAAGWEVGRFPDHLYGFFHSDNNLCPGGYNTPGIENHELDLLLETVQFSVNLNEVKDACFDAQDMIAERIPYIVTVTTPSVSAFAAASAIGHTDTLKGIVNSPGYGAENDWTFYNLHWESMEWAANPLGIGGTAEMIVGSEPTNYHPGYASTLDEWKILGRIFDGLINIDPYTHHDIPWLATSWTVEDWDYGGSEMGMNTTFWLRDDVFWHDGVQFTAYDVEFGLEFARDQQIARARPMWQHLADVEVHNSYCVSVYHNVRSLWIFYHTAGPDIWMVNDAACWATMFPKHIYEGTSRYFRPEVTINPLNPSLTCLVGTGPFVYSVDYDLKLGGYVHLTAYRLGPSPVTTHWFMSVPGEDELLTEMFHWIGDGNSDGVIDIYDLTKAGNAFAANEGDPRYDAEADTNPEPEYHTRTSPGRVDMYDIIELCKSWGKQRTYP